MEHGGATTKMRTEAAGASRKATTGAGA
jgi:hypothetical protein